ncbi:hypothetical protein ACFLZH_05590 [Patescibacteria group bacterium]
MEESKQNEMFEEISGVLYSESQRINGLRDAGEKITTEGVEPIALEKYQQAFLDIPPEFLSDEHLEQQLQHFHEHLYKLKEIYPEGAYIQLAVFPCNDLGLPYSEESINERRYLITLFVNEETGLSTGYGNIFPSTHAKLLPTEIQKPCSFKVHYESDTPWADEKDFAQFSDQYTKAFKALQKLLKSEN